MRRVPIGVTAVLAALSVAFLSVSTFTQDRPDREVEIIGAREVAAREILVRFREVPQPSQLERLADEGDAELLEPVGRSGVVRVRSRTRSAASLVAVLSNRADVAFAEPNYIVRTLSGPNDPLYPQLWGLENAGQAVNGGAPGTVGADMRAAQAWGLAIGTASNVVAVVDTGVDYTHPDLAANMWSAPAPFTVTIRGATITCQAGTHGFDAITKTCNPMDDHNHGTHVAGTIGAVGNNGAGVTGVSWQASLMGLKFLNAAGSGTVADAIDAIDFAVQTKRIFAGTGGANVRVLSNSWGGGGFSQALLDQINAAAAEDMLFVAAAGNNGLPNELIPTYPASYTAPNIVAVAATTNTDGRAFFSNYGAKTVHLGAPGVDILSTLRNGTYGFLSGTSMATPHVSGAAALTLAHCALATPSLKIALVDAVDPVPSMATTTISGGRLNVRKTLQSCSAPPETPTNVTAIAGDKQIKLSWAAAANATGYRVKRAGAPGGPYTTVASNVKLLQFTDAGLVNGTTYYYVVSSTNVLGESAASAEVSATPKTPADLVVSAFTAASTAAAGSSIAVSVTTKNQGSGAADPTATRFYVSVNSSYEPIDRTLAEMQAVPALAPGASHTTSLTLGIPPDLAPGAYYLIARSDADDVLLENVESNNTLARLFGVGPDLVFSKMTIPTIAAPGATVDAVYTVRNQGADAASATVLEFYWSLNYTLDAADPMLARVDIAPLGANATQSGQTPLVIPATVGLGTYYIFARIDPANTVAESWESNNTASSTIRVGGDLVVSALGSPATLGAGVPFVATDTTKNAGSTPVPQSTTYFYLSPDAGLSAGDPFLGSRVVGALAAGEVDSGTSTLTIPSGTPPGSYYLFAKADGANVVTETQEANNTAIRSVSVGPDLIAAIASASSPVKAGSATLVADTITNRGGESAGASLVRYYLSINFLLDASDTQLAETRAVEPLAAGGSSSASTGVTIPANTAPGYYYLVVQADASASVTESLETNNVATRLIRVDPP